MRVSSLGTEIGLATVLDWEPSTRGCSGASGVGAGRTLSLGGRVYINGSGYMSIRLRHVSLTIVPGAKGGWR